jgi:hypothetical protein
LVEFKPVFEFICLISFEKKKRKKKSLQTVSFSSLADPAFSPALIFPSRGPARLAQHCGPGL